MSVFVYCVCLSSFSVGVYSFSSLCFPFVFFVFVLVVGCFSVFVGVYLCCYYGSSQYHLNLIRGGSKAGIKTRVRTKKTKTNTNTSAVGLGRGRGVCVGVAVAAVIAANVNGCIAAAIASGIATANSNATIHANYYNITANAASAIEAIAIDIEHKTIIRHNLSRMGSFIYHATYLAGEP